MFFTKIYIKLFKFIINKISISKKTIYLGTKYGGWHFLNNANLENSLMVSAGVGEDVSFDIEMINKYKINAVLIDPTPRAIEHIEKLIEALGKSNTEEFLEGGNQPVEAYNLKNISIDDFTFIKKALFNKSNEIIKFFGPPNQSHVSHSISNWQNNFSKNSDYIEVATLRIIDITNLINNQDINILKLDIEGAEIQVITDLIKSNILPNQILVEFDELYKSSLMAYLKTTYIFIILFLKNYKTIDIDNFPNFLFVKKELI
jgi:FkbM family methyltransferase